MAGNKRDDLDLLSFSNPFDASSCSNEDDNYYPPELLLILKKYQKKDPNTRIKAFADLVAYASDLNEEKASYVISIINRYFGNWVQDPERSIRQDALEILSIAIAYDKKQIQSIFTSMFYPLLTCLFDPNRTVVQSSKDLIFDRYFDSKKLDMLLEKHGNLLLEEIKSALVTECTYEESVYEKSDAEWMHQRRITCALNIFSLLLEKANSSVSQVNISWDYLGGKSHIQKLLTFFKKPIFECINKNFSFFEGNQSIPSNFSEQVFSAVIVQNNSEYFNLMLKYLPFWIREKKSLDLILKFFASNFDLFLTGYDSLPSAIHKKMVEHLWSERQNIFQKYFLSTIDYFLKMSASQTDKFVEEILQIDCHIQLERMRENVFCYLTNFLHCRITKLSCTNTLVQVLKAMVEFDCEKMHQFLLSVSDSSRSEKGIAVFENLANPNLYFFLLAKFDDLGLNFDLFSVHERIDLISKSNEIISSSRLKCIFPGKDYEFDQNQKLILLYRVDDCDLWNWMDDLNLFDFILTCDISTPEYSIGKNESNIKNAVIRKYSSVDFLVKYFENFSFHDEQRETCYFSYKSLFPLQIQLLIHLLFCRLPDSDLIGRLQNLEIEPSDLLQFSKSFFEAILPFVRTDLIDFYALFIMEFFHKIPTHIFLDFWKSFVDSDLRNESVVMIASDPYFLSQTILNIMRYELKTNTKYVFSYSMNLQPVVDVSNVSITENVITDSNRYESQNKFRTMQNFILFFYDSCHVDESNDVADSLESLSFQDSSTVDTVLAFFLEGLVNFLPLKIMNYSFLQDLVSYIKKIPIQRFPDGSVENLTLILMSANFFILQEEAFRLLCHLCQDTKHKENFISLIPLLIDPFLQNNFNSNRIQSLLLLVLSTNYLSEPLTKYNSFMITIFDHIIFCVNHMKFTFSPSIENISFAIQMYLSNGIFKYDHFLFLLECNFLVGCLFKYQGYVRSIVDCYKSDPSQPISISSFIKDQISPLLIQSELAFVSQYKPDADSKTASTFSIKALQSSTSKSIIATYSIDEIKMNLTLTLPPSYPLLPVSVSTGDRAGVSEKVWRSWILSTRTLLCNQSGRLLDGLLLWKSNADKRFEGVEDCTICVSIFHPVDRSLPSQTCKTCKQKFHSSCLFKWFSTSGNSTCPLCRGFFG